MYIYLFFYWFSICEIRKSIFIPDPKFTLNVFLHCTELLSAFFNQPPLKTIVYYFPSNVLNPAVTTGAVCAPSCTQTQKHICYVQPGQLPAAPRSIYQCRWCAAGHLQPESLFTAALSASEREIAFLELKRYYWCGGFCCSALAPKAILSGLSKRENVIKCAQRERRGEEHSTRIGGWIIQLMPPELIDFCTQGVCLYVHDTGGWGWEG